MLIKRLNSLVSYVGGSLFNKNTKLFVVIIIDKTQYEKDIFIFNLIFITGLYAVSWDSC